MASAPSSSKAKPTAPAPFKTHASALVAFQKIISNASSDWIAESLGHKPSNKHAAFAAWAKRCEGLPPWSQSDLMIVLSARSDSNQRMSDVLQLLRHPYPSSARPLWRALLSWGVKPEGFIAACGVSPLGFAAYAKSPSALKMLLKHCSPPVSRLLLLKEHLDKPDKKHEQSTLLHRMLERFSTSVGSDYTQTLQCVQAIVAHDPEALLCLNAQGLPPDHFGAPGTPLRDWVAAQRAQLMAQTSSAALNAALPSPKARARSPKKM